MTTLWEKLKAEGGALLAHLAPFARKVAEDEVAALKPLAERAVVEVAAEAAGSGSLSDFAGAAAGTLIATAHKAEALGIQTSGASLLAAVAGALHPPAATEQEQPAAPATTAAAAPALSTPPTTAAVPAKPAAAPKGDAS